MRTRQVAGEAQSCETLSLQENMDLRIDIKTKSHASSEKRDIQINTRSSSSFQAGSVARNRKQGMTKLQWKDVC